MSAPLAATEAERLGRLRMMVAEARNRAADQSDLGKHLALVAIDGVGELAIGICLYRRGQPPGARESVPVMLDRLLADLGAPKVPGVQGFRDLHVVRNQVQHRGILPDGDQVPRWLEETEDLIGFIVKACFDVDLSEVGSASAVEDESLREMLEEAERLLEADQLSDSIEECWRSLNAARLLVRRNTGLKTASGLPARRPSEREAKELRSELQALAERLEMSMFATEQGEWMWFKQYHHDGTEMRRPKVSDARRAFVFVLSWVLRAESYMARHDTERWKQWHEMRAPSTDLPGGPHIREVWHGRKFPDEEAWEWGFQLTDVPDYFNPDFSWGIQAAQEGSDNPLLTYAYLDMSGRLFIRFRDSATPEQVQRSARQLIEEAKTQMRERVAADQGHAEDHERVITPFVDAIEREGCAVKQILVKDEWSTGIRGRKPTVWIELAEVGTSGTTRFPRFLEESFSSFFPDRDATDCEAGFADVSVPPDWPPELVARWLADGQQKDAAWDAKRIAELDRAKASEDAALSEVRRLLDT